MTSLCFVLALQNPAEGIGIDQRLDARVSLDLPFRDETGREVRLGEYFGRRPVILAFVYFRCPSLCGEVLDGLYAALKTLPGEDYDIVAVSLDPREPPGRAVERRRGKGHYLTGEEPAVRRLAEEVGFRYRYDAGTGLYAHAAGIMVLTPTGRVSRYFYGIEFSARDLRLGLVDASEGRIGSLAERLTLLCLRYDAATGRYSLAVLAAVRLAGALGALALAATILLLARRERRRKARHGRA